jgi:dihydrodipicolinate synthase/N-acetylneuraminate lyase
MKALQGVLAVVATPFAESGEVDEGSLERVIEHLLEGGADALVMFGIGGEFYKLSDDERLRMAERLVASTRGRAITVASVTRHATHLAVAEARRFQELGVDALMLLPPFFLGPDAASLVRHMRAVVDAGDLPVILQYAPLNTGVPMRPEAFLELWEERRERIYVKAESQPPGPLVSALVERSGGAMGVFIGNAGQHLFDCLQRGATGVMPGSSLLKVYRTLLDLHAAGEQEAAFALYNQLVPYLNIVGLSAERFIHFEKRILARQGIFAHAGTREPAYHPDPVEVEMFERYLERLQAAVGE